MDGYETCVKLKEFADIPVIFATASSSLDIQLRAFDAGGEDIITKPFASEILLRKISLAIQRKRKQDKENIEKNLLHSMAMNFLSAVGEHGVLQKFMQASLNSGSHKELGQHLVEAIQDFGLDNCVLIRGDESMILTSHGEPSAIEISILEQSSSIGRIFQFKSRLVVNFERVSAIVTNMPLDDLEKAGRIRDNIAMLVEMTGTMCENVDIRQASKIRAEQMQVALSTSYQETTLLNEMRHQAQADLRMLLQKLVDDVSETYGWLGITQQQEDSISKTMYNSVEKILNVLEATGIRYDQGFEKIQSSLRPEFGGDIQLF